MKRFIAFVLILSGVLSIGNKWRKSSDSYVRDRVLLLHSEKGSCTGIEVQAPSKRTYVLSAGHCAGLAHDKKMLARDDNGYEYLLDLLDEDPKSDLIVLSAPNSTTGIEIAKHLDRTQDVHTLTHGKGLPTYRTDGVVIGEHEGAFENGFISSQEDMNKCTSVPKNQAMMTPFGMICVTVEMTTVATAQVVPGSSGGPLLDKQGRLVGIVSATDDQFSYFVRLSDVIEFMKDR